MRRAALHATLGDPVRLAIVETLILGDASPTELRQRVGIASNLMAHHLNHLERAGLVGRHRSEADGRRTYVQVNRDLLTALDANVGLRASRVVFVCTANSARSHMATALWRQASEVPTASGGTHPGSTIAAAAIASAARHRTEIPVVPPVALADIVRDDDLIVTVCDSAHEELLNPQSLHWSIPDPVVVGTDAAFDHAFTEIAARIADLAPRLTPST